MDLPEVVRATERLAALRQQQVAARNERRNAGKRQRRADSTTGIESALGGHGQPKHGKIRRLRQMGFLLLLQVIAACQTEVAVAFVLGSGRSARHLVPDPSQSRRDHIATAVESAYASAPPEQIGNMLTSVAYYGTWARLCAAAKYVVEFYLFKWLCRQNCQKGVAPKNWQLLAAARGFIPDSLPLDVRLQLAKLMSEGGRASNKWLQSFRLRWGARQKQLEVGEQVTLNELRDKAASLHSGFHFDM